VCDALFHYRLIKDKKIEKSITLNRKSRMVCRTVSLPVTLNDL